ncbi:hypothetical protein R75461_08055 [Paraburkholderia nemoris]|uniref:hypothetical protein n=1 Tax=Paraburkholderia nemoris TaxID=2793076 RepID=UPI00190C790F|nr:MULTISPECIES: hypothetical protein [Paraburkholderia]MBK3786994.1 hypothetical protein [Paraburkholderia aspalathi]CAE6862427.1 hypothetical protein R75461_08055 [Paraburkholderia nemoris]
MNRTHLKCSHCDTAVARAASHCPGCQAKLCRGAPLGLHLFALVAAIAIGAACASALGADESWVGWMIGLAAMVSAWGLLDRLYENRVRFTRNRASGPDA